MFNFFLSSLCFRCCKKIYYPSANFHWIMRHHVNSKMLKKMKRLMVRRKTKIFLKKLFPQKEMFLFILLLVYCYCFFFSRTVESWKTSKAYGCHKGKNFFLQNIIPRDQGSQGICRKILWTLFHSIKWWIFTRHLYKQICSSNNLGPLKNYANFLVPWP